MEHLHLKVTREEAETLKKILAGTTSTEIRAAGDKLLKKLTGQIEGNSFFMEKALEYQQVSALLVQDVEILYEIAHGKTNPTVKELLDQIDLLHQQKDDMITSKEKRERRFYAAQMLYNL